MSKQISQYNIGDILEIEYNNHWTRLLNDPMIEEKSYFILTDNIKKEMYSLKYKEHYYISIEGYLCHIKHILRSFKITKITKI